MIANLNLGKYGKLFMAIAGMAVTVLQQYYGSQHWFSAVIAGLTAIGVYGVPNTPSAPPPPPPQA